MCRLTSATMKGVASFPFITRVGINSCFGPDSRNTIFECTEPNSLPRWLVGFLLVLTAEAKVGNSSQLNFCSETDQCLLFDLICETDTFQARHYDSVKWVSTEETSFFMEMAAMRAFRRLYDYITGANENGMKIDMTAPVIVKMPVKKFWEMGVYRMSFLLPAEHQMNPPRPTDDKVLIHKMPDMKVYVQSYGGWLTTMADKNKANSLCDALDLVDAKYTKGFHYAVGYNSPMTMFNRHNEVWFVAEDDPECSSSEELESAPFF